MTPQQYRAARSVLDWTHKEMGAALGVGHRTSIRYAQGDVAIPEPSARLVRTLVRLKLTMNEQQFATSLEGMA